MSWSLRAGDTIEDRSQMLIGCMHDTRRLLLRKVAHGIID